MMCRRPLAYGIAGVLLLGSCAVRSVPIAYVPETSRRSAGQHDYDAAVKAIAAVMVEDLTLPQLDSALYLYPHLGSYEMGLRMELDDRPDAAARSVSFAIASCLRRKVLADGERLAKLSWPNRVRTVAHEMIHLAEFALADWVCKTPHYWLMEGFAEWGAYRIIDRLGLESFANSSEDSRRGAGAQEAALPPLDRLATEAEWAAAEKKLGRQAVYSQAFLAVDFLIERKGLAVVLDYFARFRDAASRGDHFAAAFGEDVEAFQAEFGAHLQKILM